MKDQYYTSEQLSVIATKENHLFSGFTKVEKKFIEHKERPWPQRFTLETTTFIFIYSLN